MNVPNLSFGEKIEVTRSIAPSITEQNELASRVRQFSDSAVFLGYDFTQRDREYKNIQLKSGNALARLALAYSSDDLGRFAAELIIKEESDGSLITFSTRADDKFWQKTERTRDGSKPTVGKLDNDHLLEELLLYTKQPELEALQDEAIDSRAIVKSLERALALKATTKKGRDVYRLTTPLYTSDASYITQRTVELVDQRENKKCKQKLTVGSEQHIGDEKLIAVEKSVAYRNTRNSDDSLVEDSVDVTLSTRDALPRTTLESLLDPDATKLSPVQILHTGLDELYDKFSK